MYNNADFSEIKSNRIEAPTTSHNAIAIILDWPEVTFDPPCRPPSAAFDDFLTLNNSKSNTISAKPHCQCNTTRQYPSWGHHHSAPEGHSRAVSIPRQMLFVHLSRTSTIRPAVSVASYTIPSRPGITLNSPDVRLSIGSGLRTDILTSRVPPAAWTKPS